MNGLIKRSSLLAAFLVMLAVPGRVEAVPIPIGAVTFDCLYADDGSCVPETLGFSVYNMSGADNLLVPDFPVTSELLLTGAAIEFVTADGSGHYAFGDGVVAPSGVITGEGLPGVDWLSASFVATIDSTRVQTYTGDWYRLMSPQVTIALDGVPGLLAPGSSTWVIEVEGEPDVEIVPEPATLALLGTGLTVLATRRRRHRS